MSKGWAEKIAIAKEAREQGRILREGRRAAVEEAIRKRKRRGCWAIGADPNHSSGHTGEDSE